MEKENTKLMVVVSMLLVSIGISFAYFTARKMVEDINSDTNVITADESGTVLNAYGTLSFDTDGVYPGHKAVSGLRVTATGNELVTYDLVWKGINNLGTPLNYAVYKTDSEVTVSSNCQTKNGVYNGMQTVYEECTIDNIDALGTLVFSGTIEKSSSKATTILARSQSILATSAGAKDYYYVVLEYPNLSSSQNVDIGKGFTGAVTAEINAVGIDKSDLNVSAIYIASDMGGYQYVTELPSTGYTLNTSKSTCSNGAIPSYNDGGITISNLTRTGTGCTLYFEKD